TQYLGNYDDYVHKKTSLWEMAKVAEERARAATAPTQTALKDERRRERLEREQSRRHKEMLKELEDKIHRMEGEISALENQMARPDLYEDIDKMLKVQQEHGRLKEELEELYLEWMELDKT